MGNLTDQIGNVDTTGVGAGPGSDIRNIVPDVEWDPEPKSENPAMADSVRHSDPSDPAPVETIDTTEVPPPDDSGWTPSDTSTAEHVDTTGIGTHPDLAVDSTPANGSESEGAPDASSEENPDTEGEGDSANDSEANPEEGDPEASDAEVRDEADVLLGNEVDLLSPEQDGENPADEAVDDESPQVEFDEKDGSED